MPMHKETDDMITKEMDRREFLKRTALTTGAIAATMALPGFLTGRGNAVQVRMSA